MFQKHTCYQFSVYDLYCLFAQWEVCWIDSWQDSLGIQCDITLHHYLSAVDILNRNKIWYMLLFCVISNLFE